MQNVAVIDIGSNSVRLVVYNGIGAKALILYNESVTCALAKKLEQTNRLSQEGIAKTEEVLARFMGLIAMMEVATIDVVATAAVRDAEDGEEFVHRLKQRFQCNIRVLTGEEEARYSALGVLSTIPEAKGIVGDLGGGSLEFSHINEHQQIGTKESIALGIVRLNSMGRNQVYLNNFVKRYLNDSPIMQEMQGKYFYAVGGGFRTLAKIHMQRRSYPLRIIDQYSITKEDFLQTLYDIPFMLQDQIDAIPSISSKRVELLPITALIARNIIEIGNPSHIVFSASGIREGIIYDKEQGDKSRSQHPLIASAITMLKRVDRNPEYGDMLLQWLDPLFQHMEESEQERLWRHAACILSEYCCYEHTEYRAELAFRRFLDASIGGVNHQGRAFIASCLYYRYKGKHDAKLLDYAQTVLSSKQIQSARAIGIGMKIANELTGGLLGIKDNVHLEVTNKKVILFFMAQSANLLSDSIQKRIKALGRILGKNAEIIVEK